MRKLLSGIALVLLTLPAFAGPHGKSPHLPGALPGEHYVNGYLRANGTYVQGHYQTNPDGNFYNNWSTQGNINPYTGKEGTKSFPLGDPGPSASFSERYQYALERARQGYNRSLQPESPSVFEPVYVDTNYSINKIATNLAGKAITLQDGSKWYVKKPGNSMVSYWATTDDITVRSESLLSNDTKHEMVTVSSQPFQPQTPQPEQLSVPVFVDVKYPINKIVSNLAGRAITLQDGSKWYVKKPGDVIVSNWSKTDDITIRSPFLISNDTRLEMVEVSSQP